MSSITIKRCRVYPSIVRRGQEVVKALKDDMGMKASIEDAALGEFSVLVDDVPLIQRDSSSLPSVAEVEAAVWNASPASMAAGCAGR